MEPLGELCQGCGEWWRSRPRGLPALNLPAGRKTNRRPAAQPTARKRRWAGGLHGHQPEAIGRDLRPERGGSRGSVAREGRSPRRFRTSNRGKFRLVSFPAASARVARGATSPTVCFSYCHCENSQKLDFLR